MRLDAIDRRIVEATQGGLPLVVAPFATVAAEVGLTEREVIDRIDALKRRGAIRRIAAAPNHFRLGMTANGMSVWDVDDALVDRLGEKVGAMPFVSHCYRRPRASPDWRYNLFAMVHGGNREEVREKCDRISLLLGASCAGRDVLFSSRILKKTGLRLSRKED